MHVKISISEGTIYSPILENIENLTKLEIKEDTAKRRTMVVVITQNKNKEMNYEK